MKALEGIVVVALEQAVAAPYCTSRLADAGARVIKIERPEGDFARGYDHVARGESAYFVWLNRGKESIVLDLKREGQLLERMIAKADVFVQNLAPGAAGRAGFGSEALRSRYPRLITCDISGYGEDGPYRDMKAYDLLVQCETGLASITGAPERPGRVGVSVADIACGMYAHAAILQALFERERTGKGNGVAVSLFDAIADWMTVPLLHHDYGGRAPERVGLNHPSIAPYGVYKTGDGGEVVISIQNEREWVILCTEVFGKPEMAVDARFNSNPARVANRPALDEIIASVFARRCRRAAQSLAHCIWVGQHRGRSVVALSTSPDRNSGAIRARERGSAARSVGGRPLRASPGPGARRAW
jgi:crotonobetainyl-CoA:carnitine CoA-transferase CaiB-like acyl-CoA transferase